MTENKADNWKCADILEQYKQRYFDPLEKRVKQNYAYIFEGGYEKKCKESGVDPDPKVVEKMKKSYDTLFFEYSEGKKLHEACFNLVQRHEAMVDELARIHVVIRDNVLWEGEIPSQLMGEQCDMLKGYFESIKQMLEPINPDTL